MFRRDAIFTEKESGSVPPSHGPIRPSPLSRSHRALIRTQSAPTSVASQLQQHILQVGNLQKFLTNHSPFNLFCTLSFLALEVLFVCCLILKIGIFLWLMRYDTANFSKGYIVMLHLVLLTFWYCICMESVLPYVVHLGAYQTGDS